MNTLHIEPVRLLLDHKNTDPNIQTNKGNTALHFASVKGYIEIVKLLLDHKNSEGKLDTNPNIKNNEGDVALIFSSNEGHFGIVKLLLEHKNSEGEYITDPNIQNNAGVISLLLSAKKGYTLIVKLLLDNRADPNIKNKSGHNAYYYAINEEIKAMLRNVIDLNIKFLTKNKEEIETCKERRELGSWDSVRKLDEVFLLRLNEDNVCFSKGEIKLIQEKLIKNNYNKNLRDDLGRLVLDTPAIDGVLRLLNDILSIEL